MIAKLLRVVDRLGSANPSGIGYGLFPVDREKGVGPRNPQGAALAASKWIAKARTLGLLTHNDSWSWKLSAAGQRALKENP